MMFFFLCVPNPIFCVPSQFKSWSAHPFEPPSETYVSALHDMLTRNNHPTLIFDLHCQKPYSARACSPSGTPLEWQPKPLTNVSGY